MFEQIFFAVVRAALLVVGGSLVKSGTLTGDQLSEAVGAVMTLVAVIWSVTHKVKNEAVAPGERQTWLGGAANKTDDTGPHGGNAGNFAGGRSASS
jgi:hypothetical protein